MSTSTREERLGAGRYVEPAQSPADTTTTAHQLQTHDGASVSGILRTVPGATTVAFLMHPRSDFTHHILVPEFLSRGCAVWTQGTRTAGNDLTLIHEQALLDMAAGHKFLRECGFDEVISVGHSGGGALVAFYMRQAELPPAERLPDTPGGRPVPLGDAVMPMPDRAVFMAPHPGQGALLLSMIDPSVTDEDDPASVDPDLNPYDEANGFAEPPTSSTYSEEFVERYRLAQRARVQRIDDEAKRRVAASAAARKRFKESGDPADRRLSLSSGVITVHRTDADLRGVDLSIDPNDRPYGSVFGSRPDITDYGVIGFGRLTTPEAWLSTWSGISSRAGFLDNAAGVTVPTLFIELTGDQCLYPPQAQEMVEAIPGSVTHVRVPGRHFGAALSAGEPTGATLTGIEIGRWLE
ncbi:alpha/beta hydrolase [Janibacter corallicola]|uniref:alpha/beta hydrolase n=1 Tax=Janibacter corallicola TaxID=415212 RepID=UPI00082E530B|nr:alpha/beta hydrolase [Janibacter corallicola]